MPTQVSTHVLQDEAVTADKIAAAAVGDGLTGGAGTAVAINEASASLTFTGGTWSFPATVLQITSSPTADNDPTNKAYVDSLAAGLDPKESVAYATTQDLTSETFGASGVTYANSTGTLTQDVPTDGAFSGLDGETATLGDRILVKNQSTATQNGIYTITALGNGVDTAWVLTRAEDMDGTPAAEVSGGNFTFVEQGTAHAGNGYTIVHDGQITLGTDNIVWTQFNAATAYTAGNGIDISSYEISVRADTTGGANLATAIDVNSNGVAIKVDGSTIDANGSNQLYIPNGGVTATQIAAAVAGNGLAGGAGTALSVNVDGTTIEIAADTLGVVDAGITETQLNSSVAGDGLAGGAGTALSVNVDTDRGMAITSDTVTAYGKNGLIAAIDVEHTVIPSGLVSVDGYTTQAGNLIALCAMTDTTENGVYEVNTPGVWTRAAGWDHASDFNTGKLMYSTNGNESGQFSVMFTLAGALDSSAVTAHIKALIPEATAHAATTENITLSGTQTIDGNAMSAGELVLVTSQTTESQNGLYVVSAGAWRRSLRYIEGGDTDRLVVAVVGGNSLNGTRWSLTTDGSDVIGTDNVLASLISGLRKSEHEAAHVVANSNVILTNAGVSIDSVALSEGMRVLLIGQTTASQNGIYYVHDDAGPVVLQRAPDALTNISNTYAQLRQGDTISIAHGTNFGGSSWILSSFGGTIDTDDQTWLRDDVASFAAGDSIAIDSVTTPGTHTISVDLATNSGLQHSGGQLAVLVDGTTIVNNAGTLEVADGLLTKVYEALKPRDLGDGDNSTTVFSLPNTAADADGILVTLDGVVQKNGTDYNTVASTTAVTFVTAPATGVDIVAYYVSA